MAASRVLFIGDIAPPTLVAWSRAEGLDIVHLKHAAEAVDRLVAGPAALVVAILRLDQLAELAGLARIREIPAGKDVPFIVVGRVSDLDKLRLYAAPLRVSVFAPEPLDASALVPFLPPGHISPPKPPRATASYSRLQGRPPREEAVSGRPNPLRPSPAGPPRTPSEAAPKTPPAGTPRTQPGSPASDGTMTLPDLHVRFQKIARQTHFERLELSRTARSADVDEAYARMIQRLPEDAFSAEPQSVRHMVDVVRNAFALAYEVLIDRSKRAEYEARIDGIHISSPTPVPKREPEDLPPGARAGASQPRQQEPELPRSGSSGTMRDPRRRADPAFRAEPPSSRFNLDALFAEAEQASEYLREHFEAEPHPVAKPSPPAPPVPQPAAFRHPTAFATSAATVPEWPFEHGTGGSPPAASPPRGRSVSSAEVGVSHDLSGSTLPPIPESEPAKTEDDYVVPSFDEADDLFGDAPAKPGKPVVAPGLGARKPAPTTTGASTPSSEKGPEDDAEQGGFNLGRMAAAALAEREAEQAEQVAESPAAAAAADVAPDRPRRTPEEALAANADDWFIEARFFALTGEFEKAAAVLERCIAAEPARRHFQYWRETVRGRLLARAGRVDEARAALERAKRLAAAEQTEADDALAELDGKKKKGKGLFSR